ncbi:hypothetical protein FH403_11820 [Salmonella enterica]|nr:hypothetical protein [Salmonella enterica]ECD9475725.1 hypothetical protein [Salmonella enterica subsp. houtenae]
MKKKTTVLGSSEVPEESRLDTLVECLSESRVKYIPSEPTHILSVHLIETNNAIKAFCKTHGVVISYCGYMATCFKGNKDDLIKLRELLPENKQDCHVSRL